MGPQRIGPYKNVEVFDWTSINAHTKCILLTTIAPQLLFRNPWMESDILLTIGSQRSPKN